MDDLSVYYLGKYANHISAQEYREYLQSQILLIQERSPEDSEGFIKSFVSRQTGVPETYISVEFAKSEVLVTIHPPEPIKTGEICFVLEDNP